MRCSSPGIESGSKPLSVIIGHIPSEMKKIHTFQSFWFDRMQIIRKWLLPGIALYIMDKF